MEVHLSLGLEGLVSTLTGLPRQTLLHHFWLSCQQSLDQDNSMFSPACQPHGLLGKVDEKGHQGWRVDDQLDVLFSCQTAIGTQPI